MNWKKWTTSAFVIAVLALATASWLLAGAHDLAVVQPGGPNPSPEAQKNVGNLLAQIALAAGWADKGVASFTNKETEGVQIIQTKKPGFILSTPGFYLKYKDKFGLVPVNKIVMDGSTTVKYYVVAKKGAPAGLASLQGKSIAGASFAEADFIQKVVFENQLALNKDVTVKKMSGLSALRALRNGEVDAVLLDGKEFKSLPGLPFAGELETIWASAPIPLTGIMAVGKNATAADIQAMQTACSNFCNTAGGKGVCETFEIDGFQPASANDYAGIAAKWGK